MDLLPCLRLSNGGTPFNRLKRLEKVATKNQKKLTSTLGDATKAIMPDCGELDGYYWEQDFYDNFTAHLVRGMHAKKTGRLWATPAMPSITALCHGAG